jgi:hypothetical protein
MSEARRSVALLFLLLLIAVGAQAKEPTVRPVMSPDCLAVCREDLQLCLREARPAVEACLLGCEELRVRARRICAAYPDSDRCKLARREAEACMQKCREPINECNHKARRCVQGCQAQPDPCLLCRREHQTCVKNAAVQGRMCVAEFCADEHAKALEACADDPGSDQCRKAMQVLDECAEPCREKYKAMIDECREKLRVCREECGADDAPETAVRP